MMTKLIFFRSKNKLYARLLKWITGGNLSHVGFLMSDGDTVVSQRVTLERESLSKDLKDRVHFTLDLPRGVIVEEDDLNHLVDIDNTQILSYGWMDYAWFLPRRLFGVSVVNWPGFICSELVWAVMFIGGWDVTLEVPSPHSLMKAVKESNQP